MPVKGRAVDVRAAVRSVQQQSLASFELLLCDDASDADARAAIDAAAHEDPRVRVLSRGDRPAGGAARRNDGAALARGRYVVFFDSDDLLALDCLRDRVAWMERHSELAYGVADCRVFLEVPGDTPFAFNETSREPDLERFLRHDFPWQTAGPTWRTEALQRVGRWDESLPSWQDWDFHVRALLGGLPYARIGRSDYFYRRTRGVAYHGSVAIAHLVTRRPLLAKTTEALLAAGLGGTRPALLLGGLCFDVAWRLVCAEYSELAREVWRDAAALVPAREHREGTALLVLARHPPLRGTLRRRRFRRWPVELHHTPSETLLHAWALPFARAPISSASRRP